MALRISSRPFRLSTTARATLLAMASSLPLATLAQDTAPTQRVEVTGSAIKRIDGESALPLLVISREEISKAGMTTAAEILAKVSSNANGLSDGASISHKSSDQRGLNSANLRGIGTSSTLVLLNGRRLANFASPGDDAGVDLNNIPAGAIQRVEVLLDGASALYGTDAIGGVINFITRSDYTGMELSAYVGGTQDGGAGKKSASLSAGLGQLEKDGFSVFGVFDVQKHNSLRSTQRSFIADYDIPNRLGHLLTRRTSPANLWLYDQAQIDALKAAGFALKDFAEEDDWIVNLSVPTCNGPANVYTTSGIGGVNGCTFNYMQDTEIYPESTKASFLGRGVIALEGGHQLYGEVLLARSKTRYVNSPLPTNRYELSFDDPIMQQQFVSAYGFNPADINLTGSFDALLRLTEAGNRSSEVTSNATRFVVGASGTFGPWDYDLAFNHSVSKTADAYINGFVLYNEFIDGVDRGVIKLFEPSGAAGVNYINSIKVNDKSRVSTGTMDMFDAKVSRSVGTLPSGSIMMALGTEFRREKSVFTPSALLLSNNIYGDSDPIEPIQATSDARNVAAAYAEFSLPLNKQVEAQLALRHDHYQGIGGTSNPKLALRWAPSKDLLVRGSFSTGFRAPSLYDLYHPRKSGTTGTLPDPVLCEQKSLKRCADEWSTVSDSNPNLKPERSRQVSLGVGFSPHSLWTVTMDYWNIQKRDLISEIGEDVILANLDKYGYLVHREDDDPLGRIDYIELHKENRGRQKVSGIDLGIEFGGVKTDLGKFSAKLNGTLVLQSKQQTGNLDPYVSNLGKFVTDSVVQRWRHRMTVDWENGAWSIALGNTFYSSYEDQNSAVDTYLGTVVEKNHVKHYSLWDASTAWAATPELKVRLGIQNLLNTSPPFSNQGYHFISGYDPSYTDPRGRYFYLSAQYRFK